MASFTLPNGLTCSYSVVVRPDNLLSYTFTIDAGNGQVFTDAVVVPVTPNATALQTEMRARYTAWAGVLNNFGADSVVPP